MNEALRTRLIHALLSFLLTAGLLFPLINVLEPSFFSPSLLFWVAGVILLFELACISKRSAFLSFGLCLLALLVWLFALHGLITVSDVVLAIALRFSGIHTALPLVSYPAAMILTVTVTLLCCFSCLRSVSFLPAFILCFGMILLLYLSGSAGIIPWFLPALLSLILIVLTDRFPETPLLSLLPFAAILVAAAYLLAGSGLESAPLRKKADELRQSILDRLFFTEPRDVFSLSSEGYYPEGQDQLGGKPDPADHPVMLVSTPRTVYLRGVVFNLYTGRNWQNTTGGRRYLRQSSRLLSERAALFDEDLPPLAVRNALCDPVTVSVRMLSSSASTLFVPQRVRELTPGGDLVPYFSNSSELFVTRNLTAGDTYSVSAPLFMAGDPGLGTLIEVCATLEDDRYEKIRETYTTLPSHLEEPVYALAREVASAASAPYEYALAIQSWLSRSFRYTLDVDPQPQNMDFVTRFLLDTKEGYCTYFASAMTVLCRMIGLPARYVEGYLAEPDENGQALVTGLSAHAWTEVYFKGFGWLTFDATPRRGGSDDGHVNDPSFQNGETQAATPAPEDTPPTPSPDPQESQNQQDQDQTATFTPDPPQESTDTDPADSPEPPPESPITDPGESPDTPPDSPESNLNPLSSIPWAWLLPVLILAALFLRGLFTSPSFLARRAKKEADRFDIWVQEVADLLSAENLERAAGETLMAFGRRIDRNGIFSVSMSPVGECVSLIRYSRAEAEESDTGLIRDTAILLKGELSRPARLRYLFRRVFLPVSKRTPL